MCREKLKNAVLLLVLRPFSVIRVRPFFEISKEALRPLYNLFKIFFVYFFFLGVLLKGSCIT